jgi:hypothetical protein
MTTPENEIGGWNWQAVLNKNSTAEKITSVPNWCVNDIP